MRFQKRFFISSFGLYFLRIIALLTGWLFKPKGGGGGGGIPPFIDGNGGGGGGGAIICPLLWGCKSGAGGGTGTDDDDPRNSGIGGGGGGGSVGDCFSSQNESDFDSITKVNSSCVISSLEFELNWFFISNDVELLDFISKLLSFAFKSLIFFWLTISFLSS